MKFWTSTILVAVFFLFFGGCSAPSSGKKGTYIKCVTVPVAGETSFALNSSLCIYFSEQLDASTVRDHIYLYGPDGEIIISTTYIDAVSAVSITTEDLTAGNYTLSITSGILSVSGCTLKSDMDVSFTVSENSDSTAPQVLSSSPENGASDVALDSSVSVTFSENIDPSFFSSDNLKLLEDGTQIDASMSYDSLTSTLLIIPVSPLDYCAEYTLESSSVYCDLSGNASASPLKLTFTALFDTTPPSILSVSPEAGSNSIAQNQSFTVVFNEGIPSSVNAELIYLNGENGTIDSTLTYNARTHSVMITPSASLNLDSAYTLFLSGEITGRCGRSMGDNQEYSFRTQKNENTQLQFTFSQSSVEMKYVPGKRYHWGVNDADEASVFRSFYIAETELSYRLWREVYDWAVDDARGDAVYSFANAGCEGSSGKAGSAAAQTDEYPVSMISWRDALVWCNAATEYLNALNGTTLSCAYYADAQMTQPIRSSSASKTITYADTGSIDAPYVLITATGMRLPTSNEWDLAARFISDADNDGTIMSAGEYYPYNYACGSAGSNETAGAFSLIGWFDANSGNVSHPLAQKNASAHGLYDMSGNMFEYVFDWGSGAENVCRAVKGGAYNQAAAVLRLDSLHYQEPYFTARISGMRIAAGCE